MAILNFAGFEVGSTAECSLVSNAGTGASAPSIVTTPVRSGSGTYALKCSCTGNNNNASYVEIRGLAATGVPDTTYSAATSYHRIYVYFETIPASSGREEFFFIGKLTSGGKLVLSVNYLGQIVVENSSYSAVATSTVACSLNTWYRFEVMSTTSASNSAYEVRIYNESGALLETMTGTCAQTNDPNTRILLGKPQNISTRALVAYFDDWAVSDSGWVGDGACVRLAPTANGATQQWTAGTNSSNYAEVDEVPSDSDTTYIQSVGTAGHKAMFEFQKPWTKSVGDTINAVKLHAVVKEPSSVTSSTVLRIESGASNQESSGYNGSTSYANLFLLSTTDPDTSAAWTLYGLADAEAGVKEANAVAVRCSTVCLMVDSGDAEADTGTGLVKVTNLRNRVDVKKVTDRGQSTSSATLAVTVNFNKDFADVSKIDVFPISNSSQKIFRVINFVDAPNPTSFSVLLFNEAGTQLALDFTWEAEGVLTSG